MPGVVEKLNISNDQYELKVEEVSFGNVNSKSSLGSDSVLFENIKLEPLIANLLEAEEKNISFRYCKISPRHCENLRFVKLICAKRDDFKYVIYLSRP